MARIPQQPAAEPEHEAERPDIAAQLEGATQRQEIPEEEEEELQLKRETAAVQRQELPEEEEEELMLKPDDQRVGPQGGRVPAEVEAAIRRARGGGQPLEGALQAQMSASLGHDFSGVRVHTDADADQLNQRLLAKAFTTGPDIFFRRGEYNPGSSGSRELIAHELTHVVQQSTGRVRGDQRGMIVRPVGDAFEQEAEHAAAQRSESHEKSNAGGATRAEAGPSMATMADSLVSEWKVGNCAAARLNANLQKERLGEGLTPVPKVGARAQGSQVVQRRVGVTKKIEELKEKHDPVVWTSIDYALGHAEGPIQKLGEKVTSFKRGEKLYIVGHGTPGRIEGVDAKGVADQIKGMYQQEEGGPSIIGFTSCYAGKAPAGGVDVEASVVGQVRAMAEGMRWRTRVFGARGPSVKHRELGEGYVVSKPAHKALADALRRALEERFQIKSRMDDLRVRDLPPKARAREVAKVTKPMMQAYMETVKKPEPRGVAYEAVKTYIKTAGLVTKGNAETLLDHMEHSRGPITLDKPRMLEMFSGYEFPEYPSPVLPPEEY
jgi:hypothetical protein